MEGCFTYQFKLKFTLIAKHLIVIPVHFRQEVLTLNLKEFTARLILIKALQILFLVCSSLSVI